MQLTITSLHLPLFRLLFRRIGYLSLYFAIGLSLPFHSLAQTPVYELDAIKAAKFNDAKGMAALLRQGLISPNMTVH